MMPDSREMEVSVTEAVGTLAAAAKAALKGPYTVGVDSAIAYAVSRGQLLPQLGISNL